MSRSQISWRKLLGIVLVTVGIHSGAFFSNPDQWLIVLGLLIPNLALNIGSYLLDPSKKFEIPVAAQGVTTIHRHPQVGGNLKEVELDEE